MSVVSRRSARSVTVQAPASPPTQDALSLLRRMQLIRVFEERARNLFFGGAAPGLVHLCAGQEAMAVGAGALPLAAGAALSAKRRSRDEVAAGFFGDGALKGCLSK